MKKINKYIGIVLFLGVYLSSTAPVNAQPYPAEILGIYFTPPTGAALGIVKHISQAKKSIRVMAYGFTSDVIAQALIRASERGVQVELIQDEKSATNNASATRLLLARSIEVRSDGEHAIAHNKIILIDDDIVITGSYNFTQSAEKRNAENVLMIRSSEAMRRYSDNWHQHWAHAVRVDVSSLSLGRHKP